MPSDTGQDPRADLIRQLFDDSVQANRATLDAMNMRLVAAADCLIACIEADAKILSCGNGGSAGDAQHFSSEMVNRFERERRALAAVALTTETSTMTAIANDYDYSRLFARQVEALGRPGDVLLAFTTSGHSINVLKAVPAAHDRGMRVIVFTGKDGGALTDALADDDIELRAAADSTARIQEMHLLFIHCLCRLIEDFLFGQTSNAKQ